MHRFFLSSKILQENVPVLQGTEAHHCLNVLRLKTGDRIVVFDGCGNEATARIRSIAKDEVALDSLLRGYTPALPVQMTLAQAIPKAKNMDLIIQKAVELGATCIAPLISERTIIQIESPAQKQSKWQAVAIEACKQCGQNWLPRILLPTAPQVFLDSMPPQDLFLIASLQPGALRLKEILANYQKEHQKRPASVTIFIGPEGDFTPAEIALAKSKGCQPITLGPIVLRTETAALYSLSILSYELN